APSDGSVPRPVLDGRCCRPAAPDRSRLRSPTIPRAAASAATVTRRGTNWSETGGRLPRSRERKDNGPDEPWEWRTDGAPVADQPSKSSDRDLDRVASVLVTIALRIVQREEGSE